MENGETISLHGFLRMVIQGLVMAYKITLHFASLGTKLD
jgi:hypothetical protein